MLFSSVELKVSYFAHLLLSGLFFLIFSPASMGAKGSSQTF